MKNMVLWVFFLFFVIAVIVFLLGPRAELTVKISAIDLPADLDIYLEKIGSAVSPISFPVQKK